MFFYILNFYFLCYISFYVACAFVICLIKYLLTYLLTYLVTYFYRSPSLRDVQRISQEMKRPYESRIDDSIAF